ncbi:hypothetical protein [Granulicella sp. L60]|uniref:SLAC1 family transporter n=1 Tax=Granulicella sp. L60 TaxID=1641866 RepID=UPI0020B1384D|nr:hypothetical protein [Granulicella sp. L60]
MNQINRGQEMIRQFTPNWFTATMGTGILALALNQFPAQIPGLHAVDRGLWFLNIGLFLLFSILYATCWIVYYDEARRILAHSVVSMFFGAIPMGLATIINGFMVFGILLWGNVALQTARGLWWIDVLLAVGCGCFCALHDVYASGAQSGKDDGGCGSCPLLLLRWRRSVVLSSSHT